MFGGLKNNFGAEGKETISTLMRLTGLTAMPDEVGVLKVSPIER
jgi:hypothetical protein